MGTRLYALGWVGWFGVARLLHLYLVPLVVLGWWETNIRQHPLAQLRATFTLSLLALMALGFTFPAQRRAARQLEGPVTEPGLP